MLDVKFANPAIFGGTDEIYMAVSPELAKSIMCFLANKTKDALVYDRFSEASRLAASAAKIQEALESHESKKQKEKSDNEAIRTD